MESDRTQSNARTLRAARAAPVSSGGYLIAEARLRSRLTQAELASRVGTSQSLVARWETGLVSPSFSAVVRAVRACGLELSVGLFAYDGDHDLLISDQLNLTPVERAQRMVEHSARSDRLRHRSRAIDE